MRRSLSYDSSLQYDFKNKEIKITDQNFDELVIKAEKLVIVDFWAEWCGPCKAIAPILDKISDEFSDNVLIGKVNVDEVKEVPVKYGIRSIPTLILFRGGHEVARQAGAMGAQDIMRWVASQLPR